MRDFLHAGPMVGGELVYRIGFPWLMRTVGLVNVLYSPLLILLSQKYSQQVNDNKRLIYTKYYKTFTVNNHL